MYKLNKRCQPGESWPRPRDIPPLIHSLLISRGISSEEEARAFLWPSEQGLHDPFLFPGMDRAVSRIRAAQAQGETVCVWGDYDVDGICATAILTMYLESQGIKWVKHIPHRHGEGYGLNKDGIRAEAARANLLITVDCGISCRAEVALARELGMDVIVTDHHRPGDNMPDGLVIDPLLGGYPFDKLCGAALAFKLVQALGGLSAAMDYIDLAALATVADLVPVIGENRVIVTLGLKAMNTHPRMGVRLLIDKAGLTGKPVNAGHLGFQLAPRLNAGGRLGDAARGWALLTSTDPDEVGQLANELDHENSHRRAEETDIVKACEALMQDYSLLDHRIIVLVGEGWNSGVIGLAASRLAQEYNYPVILLAQDGDECVGSCRSIPAVDIFAALNSVADLMTRFGGHRQAAGLSMPRANVPQFIARLDEYLTDSIRPQDYVPDVEYDLDWPLGQVDQQAVRQMELMQPTGFGNPSPVFLAKVKVDSARAVGRDLSHLQMQLSQDGAYLKGICYGQGSQASAVIGTERSLLYVPQINEWRGQVSVECEVKALLSEPSRDVVYRFIDKYPRFLRTYLTQLFYNTELNSNIDSGRPVSVDQVADWLRESPQGTLICALTLDGVKSLTAMLGERGLMDQVDAYVGQWSQDPTRMNALCLCPVGQAAGPWRRIVLWDAPAAAFGSLPQGDVYAAGQWSGSDFMTALPDVAYLRRVYMSARLFARTPVSRVSVEDLERDLARATGLTEGVGLMAALAVLRHMGLIDLDVTAARLSVPPSRKSEPEADGLYQRMMAMQAGRG